MPSLVVVSLATLCRSALLRALVVAAFATVLVPNPATAADLNCSDFGTRERAQRELQKSTVDIHGLDGDGDGKACEWNNSTGWVTWPVVGAALVLGRFTSRRRRGDHTQVTGIEGLWHNYQFDDEGNVDEKFDTTGIVLVSIGGVGGMLLVNVARDYLLPRSFTPAGIWTITAAVAFGAAFAWDQLRGVNSTDDDSPELQRPD